MFQFTMKQLRYVEAAGRLGSIANAAGELNISQSSVTAAIDAFEERVGYTIFSRMPAKGIVATPTGREVLTLVRGFLDQAQHFSSDLASIAGTSTGVLRMACYVTAAPYIIPGMLREFTRENPGIRVDLREGDMVSINGLLHDGEVDLVCTFDGMLTETTSFLPLFEARPVAVLAADHPLALKQAVTLAELCEMPMVLLDLPATRDYFLDLFHSHGLKPEISHSTRSAEIVRGLVAGGFGFSILNVCTPDEVRGRSGFVCRPLAEDVSAPQLGLAYLAGIRMPKVVSSFLHQCHTYRDRGGFHHLTMNPSIPGV